MAPDGMESYSSAALALRTQTGFIAPTGIQHPQSCIFCVSESDGLGLSYSLTYDLRLF